jgi:hypothetical protein
MGIPNKQIGWSQESNLLWQVSKEVDKLIDVTGSGISNITSVLATKINNDQGVPSFLANSYANLPAPGVVGRMFIATDTFSIYRDNGTGWDLIGGPGTGTITGTGASGQVAFWNGTSSQTGDNGLFWDNTNKRLGVGTNAPSARLHISGSGLAGSITVTDTDITNASFNSLRLFASGQNRFSLGVGTTNSINSIIALHGSSTNVSIGTTTDAGFRLDVNGTARVQGPLTVTGSTTASGAIARGSNFTPTLVAAANNDVLVGLDINPAFNDGGLAGISRFSSRISNSSFNGTALVLQGPSPGRALHVLSNSQVLFQSPLTMSGSLINFNEPTGLSSATTLGEITSGGAHWSAVNVTRILFAASGGVWGPSSKPTKITFSTTNVGNTTATEKVSIGPSGNVIIQDGGTLTDAGFRLDVNGSARVQGTLTVSAGGANITGAITGSANITSNGGSLVSQFGVVCQGNDFALSSSVNNTGFIRFLTQTGGTGVERLRIFNNGNVGINTQATDSGFRLDVNGTARVQGDLTITGTNINMQALTGVVGNSTVAGVRNNGGSLGYVALGFSSNLLSAISISSYQNANTGFLNLISDSHSLTTTYANSAVLEVRSTTRGFLPPRMTGAQAEAIASPAEGLLIYATIGSGTTITSKGWWGFEGATWNKLN